MNQAQIWWWLSREQRGLLCSATQPSQRMGLHPSLSDLANRTAKDTNLASPPPHFRYGLFNGAMAKKIDVSFYRKSKMAAVKTEAAITFEREITTRFQLLTPHFYPTFSTRLDLDMTLSTLPDSRHFPMLADYRNSRWRPSKPDGWPPSGISIAGNVGQYRQPVHGRFFSGTYTNSVNGPSGHGCTYITARPKKLVCFRLHSWKT